MVQDLASRETADPTGLDDEPIAEAILDHGRFGHDAAVDHDGQAASDPVPGEAPEGVGAALLQLDGHGPLSGRKELAAYRDMLVAIRDRIAPMVAAHHTLEEIRAAEPTASFDEQWGGGWIAPDDFVSFVYDSLSK